MAALTIPTIFSAIDKMTAPLRKMTGGVHNFAVAMETGIARGERAFRKLTPVLGSAAKQFLSFASTAAIAGAIVSGVHFSIQSLKDYETAVASFRTIVSDATDTEFEAYKKQIASVATTTKRSTIEVAQSFEMIAGLNERFAETAEGLGAVSKAAIVLSRASGDELGVAAQNLVGIMNQFSMQATEADRAINVLAAGQAVGAANITQTSEAFKNFGSVAAGANITLEESVGLVQTLGKFSLFGAEAGTKLRGSVLKLQQAGVGYASGQFNINDALAEAKAKLDRLSTAKQKDAYLTKIFGAENITAGRILIENIELYKGFAKSVTGTTEAHKAAEINSQTLTVAIQELKNTWINMITTSDKAGSALETVKSVVGFLARNMDTIVSLGSKVLIFFVAWKALLITSKVALFAFNVVSGVTIALQGKSAFYVSANTIAYKAFRVAVLAGTAAQWLLNAALTANPIGVIIMAIAGLIALVVVMIEKWNEWGAAMAFLLGPIGWVVSLIQSFRRNWDMIKKSFAEGGILEGLKAIGKTLLDAVLQPLQQILEIVARVTGFEWADNAAKNLAKFREDLGVNVTTDESGEPLKPVNPEKEKQEALVMRQENTTNANVNLNINDPNNRVTPQVEGAGVNIKTTSTQGF